MLCTTQNFLLFTPTQLWLLYKVKTAKAAATKRPNEALLATAPLEEVMVLEDEALELELELEPEPEPEVAVAPAVLDAADADRVALLPRTVLLDPKLAVAIAKPEDTELEPEPEDPVVLEEEVEEVEVVLVAGQLRS